MRIGDQTDCSRSLFYCLYSILNLMKSTLGTPNGIVIVILVAKLRNTARVKRQASNMSLPYAAQHRVRRNSKGNVYLKLSLLWRTFAFRFQCLWLFLTLQNSIGSSKCSLVKILSVKASLDKVIDLLGNTSDSLFGDTRTGKQFGGGKWRGVRTLMLKDKTFTTGIRFQRQRLLHGR